MARMLDTASRPQDRVAELLTRLRATRKQAEADPFTNPFLLFALELTGELESGDATLDQIRAAVESLTAEAFEARADRLARYLGDCAPDALEGALSALFGRVADQGSFDDYARELRNVPFGIVLTAHPTFALDHELSLILAELGSGFDVRGKKLDGAARADRLARAAGLRHGPPAPLTLDIEHAWSVEALENLHCAMETIYRCALRVARERWPQAWTDLAPHLVSIATWVGFDTDGRTDVTWQVSFGKRLALKRLATARRLKSAERLANTATPAFGAALKPLQTLLSEALYVIDRQIESLGHAQADPAKLEAFAQAMVDGRSAALVEAGPILSALQIAIDAAPGEAVLERLLVMKASIVTEGVSLARIHVRLNASQLHNAIRRTVGLDTSPTDPANRHTYFASIDALIENAKPMQINFGDLAAEPASAPRLMMTLAQMVKFVDASTPVRFLIAETEAGFTLLTALYFAHLFGVEPYIEISPLFETAEGFDRGERVIEEALRSEHYREHLRRHGRLAIEFGFSDSGRFVGQMATTFKVERLRFRLAQMMEEQGLEGLEIIFFNTHGESIGRGGHPASLADRFRYAAPPRSRVEFESRGVRVREEDAFQGGEGYLPLLTPAAALATLTTALQSVLVPDPEAVDDPIYDDPDFASEFFATVEQDFRGVVADPDYAALLGLFGTNLLPKTGSRAIRRQTDGAGGLARLNSVSALRAIPNNALLQQLGYMANTLFGVGHAALKDEETFRAMLAASPRFRRALDMVAAAYRVSDRRVTEAYAATLDPRLWARRAHRDVRPELDVRAGVVAERAGLSEQLSRFLRKIDAEDLALKQALEGLTDPADIERRERLLLLHALRVTLIQRICLLAVQFPSFNPTVEVPEASLRERLMRLDVPEALKELVRIFPVRSFNAQAAGDFGEASSYARTDVAGYADEHEQIFEPTARMYELLLQIGSAISHEIGTFG